ncbi:MAG: FUSC family protein, partial [Actinobacteria bacterium]|nr:FUSC family protein [Actinomycetota bacterium]
MKTSVGEFFEVTRLKPAFGQGFRGALVWVVFLLIGFSTDQLALGIQAGFVGWIVSFCDDAFGLGRRFAGAAVLTIIAGLATFLAMISSGTILGAVLVTAFLGACASLAAVAGPAGAKKGLVVMFLALFAVGTPGDLTASTQMAVASFAGGLATMAVMLLMVPFGRSRNPLLAVANLYRQCGDLARDLQHGSSDIDISKARMASIQSRRETYLDARYVRRSPTRKRLVVYLEKWSTIVKALVSFQDVRRSQSEPLTEATRAMYGAVADLCDRVANALETPGLSDVGITKATDAIDTVIDEIGAQPAADRVGLAVLRHLRRALVSLLDVEDEQVSSNAFAPVLGPSPWETLIVNVRYDTPLRRHLFRYVTLMVLATALYKYFEIPDGFFITIGINIMLQPDLGGSVSRLRAYALGTLAGSAIGAVLGVTLDSVPIGLAVATFITLFVMISYTRVTWWAFAVGASVFIVAALGLLVEGGFYLGLWRFVDTLIAAAMSGVGLFLLWPTRARTVIPAKIATTLRATSQYLQVATTEDQDAVGRQRSEVVRSASELSQRVNEYAREPGRSPEKVAELQETLVDVLRLYGLITDVAKADAQSRESGEVGATDDFARTREVVIGNLNVMADAFAAKPADAGAPE